MPEALAGAAGLSTRLSPCALLLVDNVAPLFEQRVALQLLLAALGNRPNSAGGRIVTYRRQGRVEVARFSGGIIAMSNLQLGSAPLLQAFKSRVQDAPFRLGGNFQQEVIGVRAALEEHFEKPVGHAVQATAPCTIDRSLIPDCERICSREPVPRELERLWRRRWSNVSSRLLPVGLEPGIQIGGPGKIKQRIGQLFQVT